MRTRSAISAAAIAAGVLAPWPRWALTAGSALFVVVSARILFIQPNLPNCVMGLGAVAWSAGNGLWTRGHETPQIVLWWLTFLLLTIMGERIELTRFQKPSRSSRPWLLTTLVMLGAGLAIGWFAPRAGGVLMGAALLGIAAWLMRFDLAWRTIGHPGLPRFMAICLLSGYVWLTLTALLLAMKWPQTSGVVYFRPCGRECSARDLDDPFILSTAGCFGELWNRSRRDVGADHSKITVVEFPDVRAAFEGVRLSPILVRVRADSVFEHAES